MKPSRSNTLYRFFCYCAMAIVSTTLSVAQQFADMSEKIEFKPAAAPTDPEMAKAKYLDEKLPLEERVQDLFSRLSMEQKAEIIHGASGYTYGKMPAIGLQEFGMFDGPQGVRLGDGKPSTALPSGIAMASTWNRDLIKRAGHVLGEECKAHNARVILGPGVNILRTPLGGRNYEYSGEDPVLAGEIAAAYINGVQERGIAACIKHWLLNEQEWARTVIDVDVDERALREIYAKPYEIAVRKGNPWTIMTSYNLVRGQYPSHNHELNKILYQDFKWDGALVSDWGAWHGDVAAINGGCTVCMPSGKNDDRNKAIVKDVEEGKISREMFDQAVLRNLRMSFRVGAFNADLKGETCQPWQDDVALKIAQEAVVLLKNDNKTLPLKKDSIKKIAVIGPNADQYHTMVDGAPLQERGGAGATRGKFEITPLKAIVDRVGQENVLYAPGFRFEKARVDSCPGLKPMDPVEAAKQADVVLYFGGTDHSYDRERLGWGILEGADKPDINLKGEQAEMIRKVAEANPNTIVVLTVGAPVQVEDWEDKVPAILCSWYGGQSAGTAVASALFGDINPSGKTPCTFGKKLTDWLCHSLGRISYPGIAKLDDKGKATKDPKEFYSDYIWVGYRHFDKAGIEPRYPFGYGLSYTTFKVEQASPASDGKYSAKVTNTGDVAGAEVVQCYISKPEGASIMPVRELIGFEKVMLQPGESKTVTFTPGESDMRYWDEASKEWKIEPGDYQISIGNSSRNLPVTYSFTR